MPNCSSGWAIADHLRTELVTDALEMARQRRKPEGTTVHSDRGAQYTSWLHGERLRRAGLTESKGKAASAYENALMESFWGSLQFEAWNNPYRRHSTLDYRYPIELETLHTQAATAA